MTTGDVAFGRTLRNRANVDAGIAQRAEHLCGDARRSRHPVADDGEDAAVGNQVNALDLAIGNSRSNASQHDASRTFGLRFRHRKADRMFGAALRNQDHRNRMLAQRGEQALGGARHADHAGALDVDQRDAIDARNAFHAAALASRVAEINVPGCPGANVFRIHIGMLLRHCRRHRLRMNDLRAEIRELHRLLVRQRVDHARVRHQPRIGAQHTIDIGPDMDFIGMSSRAPKIAARSRCRSDPSGLNAVAVASDEAGDHPASSGERPGRVRARPSRAIPANARWDRALPIRPRGRSGRPPTPTSPLPGRARSQVASEHPCRPQISPKPATMSRSAAGGLADSMHGLQQPAQFIAIHVQLGAILLGACRGVEQRVGDVHMTLPRAARIVGDRLPPFRRSTSCRSASVTPPHAERTTAAARGVASSCSTVRHRDRRIGGSSRSIRRTYVRATAQFRHLRSETLARLNQIGAACALHRCQLTSRSRGHYTRRK